MNFNLYDYKTRNEAITRMRGMGSAVPKKVTGKYIYTLDAINAANSIKYSNNILILYDFGCVNDARQIERELLDIQNSPTYKSFRDSLDYEQDVNMNSYDSQTNPTGNVIVQAIFELSDNISIQTKTDAIYYDGSDLTLSNYGVVILLTKPTPVQSQSTNNSSQVIPETVTEIQNGVPVSTVIYKPKIVTTIFDDIYSAVIDSSISVDQTTVLTSTINNGRTTIYTASITRSYTVSLNEYHPDLGMNLQNYINSGGNVIMGNNIWQNNKFPNFSYSNIPFRYKPNYSYTNPVTINIINYKIATHPLIKGCDGTSKINVTEQDNYVSLPEQQILNVPSDLLLASNANLIATVTISNVELPFIAAYKSQNGSKTVAFNTYLGLASENLNLIKILYNSIYWCLKKNY